MSTNNTDLFSYLPGLEVTDSEVLQAELMAQQILQAKYPDIDLREGTALRDLVIRPSATLLALMNKALVFYFSQNDISSITDLTSQPFVDKMLSNWFLTRKLGIQAVINARLYFAKAKTVGLYGGSFFSTDGVLKFGPVASMSFSPNQLTYDSSSNQYYLDVDLVAEQAGVQYNITTGSLLYFSNFDPYFLHAEINYLRDSAQNIETNSEFLARAKSSLSTRNLVNVPSIASNLSGYFSAIKEIKTVGFGDPEMARDQVKVLVPGVSNPVWVHTGGAVDVYPRVSTSNSTVQLSTDNTGKLVITGAVYKFNRSSLSGGAAADTLPVLVTRAVTFLTSTGTLATATTSTAHGFLSGDLITISGATPAGYNGTGAITVTSTTSFTYVLSSAVGASASGTMSASTPVKYTWQNTYLTSLALANISRSGTVATVTCYDHGLSKVDRIKISGSNGGGLGFNGVFNIDTVPSKDSFTYTVPNTLPSSAFGVLLASFVDRTNDVGFSDRQSISVDFGSTYANTTASFSLNFHQNIDGIQSYLVNSSNRVVCADMLARGFNLTFLDLVITGYSGPAPSADLCNTTTSAYLSTLKAGQPFIMSDLLSALSVAGITTIQTPIGVTYNKYWNDLMDPTSGTILDILIPDDSRNVFMVNSLITTNLVI